MGTELPQSSAKRHKWPKISRRKNAAGSISFCVDLGRLSGRRVRKFFKTRLEADTYAEQQRTLKLNQGTAAFSIDDKLRVEAVEARRLLLPHKVSLIEAAKYYLKHAKPVGGSKTLIDVTTELIQAKIKSGRRDKSVQTYRYTLERFNRVFGHRLISDVHAADVEGWLDANSKTLGSRANYQRVLILLFNYAMKRRYCAANPMESIDRPQLVLKAPEIFSVDQAETTLRVALAKPELELVPYFSIGLFAGLRPTELERLDWSHVRLEQRVILVNADASKTSQKRFVDISENLRQWLEPVLKTEGPVVPSGLSIKVRQVFKATCAHERGAVEKWPRDGMRHSYASYHLAKYQNAPQTSLQMGHRSPQMLFNHYRNLVLAADAERFWNITPESIEAGENN